LIFRNLTKNDFKVVVGAHKVYDDDTEKIAHDVRKFIIHPNYNSTKHGFDIALVRLENNVNLTSRVGLVNLTQEDIPYPIGKFAKVFGWGLDEKNQAVSALKEIKMEIVSKQVCERMLKLGKIKMPSLESNQLCAVGEEVEATTCFGDSGGICSLTISTVKAFQKKICFLVGGIILSENEMKVIVGVVSLSSSRCSPYFPTVFAYLQPSLKWIKETMEFEEKVGNECLLLQLLFIYLLNTGFDADWSTDLLQDKKSNPWEKTI